MKPRSLALGLAALVLSHPAVAATCLDEVHALAEANGVTSKPPVTAPDKKQTPVAPGVTSNDLAKSGGVIAPPPIADNSVIKPPGNTDPGMSTIPDKRGPDKKPAPGAAGAGAERSALQAALTAARHHAEDGDEQACRQSLAKARELAEAH